MAPSSADAGSPDGDPSTLAPAGRRPGGKGSLFPAPGGLTNRPAPSILSCMSSYFPSTKLFSLPAPAGPLRLFRPPRPRGFTLVELLVVVVIIGILAVIALSRLERAYKTAREGKTFAHLHTMRTAIRMSYTVNHEWPPSITSVGAPTPDNWGDIPHDDFKEFIGPQFPEAMVYNTIPFDDGNTAFTGGVYQTTNADATAGGNYRGWIYSPVSGNLKINNNSSSSGGKNYNTY